MSATSPGTALLARLSEDQVAALAALRWMVDAVAGTQPVAPARPQGPSGGAPRRCMVPR